MRRTFYLLFKIMSDPRADRVAFGLGGIAFAVWIFLLVFISSAYIAGMVTFLAFLLTGIVIRAAQNYNAKRLDRITIRQHARNAAEFGREGIDEDNPALPSYLCAPTISWRRRWRQIELNCTVANAIEIVRSCAAEFPKIRPVLAVYILSGDQCVIAGTVSGGQARLWPPVGTDGKLDASTTPACVRLHALRCWNWHLMPGVVAVTIGLKGDAFAALTFASVAVLWMGWAALWIMPPIEVFADRIVEKVGQLETKMDN
jgi:hypothetical protein